MLTIVFFLYPVYTMKRLRKTNSIHIEILKERDAMVVIRECANINIKIEEKEEKQNQLDEKQSQLDEKQNRLDKYEKEIEELKRQLAEKQTA